MVQLTFYGGVGEVGGNKILLEDENTKVFLDFGISYSQLEKYYAFTILKPRDEKDLLRFQLIPDLKGLYKWDICSRAYNAVVISHPHQDHAKYISLIKKDIPVHCGETTKTVLEALNASSRKSFDTDLSSVNWNIFRTKQAFTVGKGKNQIEFTPVHVDHSVPGAYGFIIKTSKGTIIYTGDFRTHGKKPNLTEDFVNEAKNSEQPRVMICEGTNLAQARMSSEDEVKTKVVDIVKDSLGIIFAYFGLADIDRLRTFYEVARQNNRDLVISERQACLLHRLKGDKNLRDTPDIQNDRILILKKERKSHEKWETALLSKYISKVKTGAQIGSMQDKVICVLTFYDLNLLTRINPQPGSTLIHACSEPFNDEDEINFGKLGHWLDEFGLTSYQIHASGHITPHELMKVLNEIKPERIIPVHTEHPELFKKHFEVPDREVSLPTAGVPMDPFK